jgi:glycosyltransferase involved in cell wall biosynthesis
MKISATIITLNEERNIGRCLESLEGVVDEIIVLDSFSTDRTEEICRNFNVKFSVREWEGYSASKNYANGIASYDWILSIDADEALSEELATSITTLKNQLKEGEVYQFNRLTNYCGKWIKHSGWYPDKKIRIFNKKQVQWEGNIHEHLALPQGTKVKHLNGDLLHYSYYSIRGHLKQTEKFSSLSAQMLFNRKKKPTFTKLYINPIIKFLKDYILRLGFLDGYYGFIICKISAQATRLKYLKLQKMYKGS